MADEDDLMSICTQGLVQINVSLAPYVPDYDSCDTFASDNTCCAFYTTESRKISAPVTDTQIVQA